MADRNHWCIGAAVRMGLVLSAGYSVVGCALLMEVRRAAARDKARLEMEARRYEVQLLQRHARTYERIVRAHQRLAEAVDRQSRALDWLMAKVDHLKAGVALLIPRADDEEGQGSSTGDDPHGSFVSVADKD